MEMFWLVHFTLKADVFREHFIRIIPNVKYAHKRSQDCCRSYAIAIRVHINFEIDRWRSTCTASHSRCYFC